MDRRRLLSEGTRLAFPGMQCTVESFVGKGSNAIVYLGSYPDQQQPELRHRVLIKELFPYHPQGAVYRNEQEEICFDADGKDTMRLHSMSFNRGNEVHIRLQGSHPGEMDFHINTFSLHHTMYSVMGFSGGRSLDKELAMPGAEKTPLTVHIRRMAGVLNVLEAFHESGYLHLDISPDNILLIGDGKKERLSLIDYNSVHTLEEIKSGNSFYYSAKEGYTAPEIRMGRIPYIGFATDIYSLTAVFYRCITGRALTVLQMTRQTVPDLSDAKCLQGMPDTVISMLRHILRRGLAPSSSRRYRNGSAMRQDLEELQDRIEGKGITHWALWEMGRSSVAHMVKANPALEYICEEEAVYPIAGQREDGTAVTLSELYQTFAAAEGNSFVLLGGGGMGKTTALLRMAYLQSPQYSGAEPAVIYISLYGWNHSGSDYIKNKILENLRFRSETDSMETAKHELLRLFASPLHTRWGERPQVLLLLDGYNEAVGELTLLMKELSELSAMPGLRILITSRSAVTGLDFPEIILRQLEESEVTSILAQNGILPPENKEVFQLLRTPMMLSIFIKAALDGEKQQLIDLHEKNPGQQLLARYLSGMLEKENRDTPDDASRKWLTEAAVYYVLPEIANFLKAKGAALSDRELLPLIEKCYRRLPTCDMTAVFPQWIGHVSDIRGNAHNAEEWYGMVVHGVLWRRLGLLIREEHGKYRAAHQLIEEYLSGVCQGFERKFIWRKRIRTCLAVLSCVAFTGIAWNWAYMPYQSSHTTRGVKKYDENIAANVLDIAFTAYANSARQYESVIEVSDCLLQEEINESEYERVRMGFQRTLDDTSIDYGERAQKFEEVLLDSGKAMPWSEKTLDTDAFEKLASVPAEQAKEYQKCMEIIELLKADPNRWEKYGKSCVEDFRRIAACGADITGCCYKILIEPEIEIMGEEGLEEDKYAYTRYLSAKTDYPNQNRITNRIEENADGNSKEELLEEYKDRWTAARSEFREKYIAEINKDEESN